MPEAPTAERIGWLLRVNRRFAGDPALRTGKAFAAAFRPRDRPALAESQVTRWESGTTAARRPTIRRYEQLLELPPDSLTTLKDALDRAAGTVTVTPADGDPRPLHELLERATGGDAMTGAHWSELTELVQGRPALLLHPPRLWTEVADRLLGELVVAEGSDWLQRQEAMSRLLAHPDAGVHAVDACIGLAEDHRNPAVVEPLSLLDVTAHPDANRHVRATVAAADDGRALYGALLAAIRKIPAGHFGPDELHDLGGSVATLLADRGLPDPLRPLAAEAGRLLTPGGARPAAVRPVHREPGPFASRVAAQAYARMLPVDGRTDRTLTALVAEALHGATVDDRLLASMCLAATPFREPVAHALLEAVTRELQQHRETGLEPALRALTNLRVADHRPLIGQILTGAQFGENARHAAAWALPHCAGAYPESFWRRVLQVQLEAWQRRPYGLGRAILHGVAYGIGTDHHRALLHDIRDDGRLPGEARSTAAWLLTAPVAGGDPVPFPDGRESGDE